MQILHLICDRCHETAIEDDALDWTETQDGRDLCPSCVFPFPKAADFSYNREMGLVPRSGEQS